MATLNALRSICAACMVALLPCATLTTAADRAGIVEELRVAANGRGHLIVPITLGTRRIAAVLDTGSTITVVDSSLKHLLGSRHGTLAANTVTSEATFETYSAPNVAVGRLEPAVAPSVFAVADLAGVRRRAKKDFQACVGMDILKNFAIQFDLENGIVRLYADLPPMEGRAVPLRITKSGIPEIYVRVSGFPARDRFPGGLWFVVDTGCVCNMDGELRRELYEFYEQRRVLVQLGSGNGHDLLGADKAPFGRLSATLTVGDQLRVSPVFYSGRENRLGLQPLASQLVTFDFMHKKAYFESYPTPASTGEKRAGSMRPHGPVRATKALGGTMRTDRSAK